MALSIKKANHSVLHTQCIDPMNRVTIYYHSIAASIRGSDITYTAPYVVPVFKKRAPMWKLLDFTNTRGDALDVEVYRAV